MRNNSKHRKVVRAISRWYKQQGRTLPWRIRAGQARNPYRVLISEVMLQQTQVSRVLVKYPEFLRRFPSLRSLASAEQREVVHAWQGMGYNNRAVRLHKFARLVIQHHGGRIPRNLDSLIVLPGIGKYTANALLSSAFGQRLPIVDVNVQRVFSRIFWRMKSTAEMRPQQECWQLAESILPKRDVYDWNQSLMDLGATICSARTPKCESCPVALLCSSRSTMKKATATRKKSEPSLDGTPNRIFRGRTIELLRRTKRAKSLSVTILAEKLLPSFASYSDAWLMALLTSLENDGLIRIRRASSFASTRIALA